MNHVQFKLKVGKMHARLSRVLNIHARGSYYYPSVSVFKT